MSKFGDKKFADAIPHESSEPLTEGHHVKFVADQATATEQSREAQEAKEAIDAEGSIREKMVAIGRGNQQSGRQGQ